MTAAAESGAGGAGGSALPGAGAGGSALPGGGKAGHAPIVAVVMGSPSDLPVMQPAADVLAELGVSHEVRVVSAHRTPDHMVDFAHGAIERGIRVIVAGAGGAAHL
ncbi:MAG TPA: AIR carboxylase family protein, partial [Acidimicrobiales bacterium]